MPWTVNQQLTSAEMGAVLGTVVPASASVAVPAMGNEYLFTTGASALTITMLSTAQLFAGQCIGVTKVDAGVGTVKIQAVGAQVIMGNGLGAGVASVTLKGQGSYFEMQFDGTNWHEVGSGGIFALGYLQYSSSAVATAFVAGVPVTLGMSAGITIGPNRRIKVSWSYVVHSNAVANDYCDSAVQDGGVTVFGPQETILNATIADNQTIASWCHLTPTPGIHTYTILATKGVAGAVVASAGTPSALLIEDIGSI